MLGCVLCIKKYGNTCHSQTLYSLFAQSAYTNFSLSWWLIIDINFVLGLLCYMDLGSVADNLESHATYMFWAEECSLVI
jgi:hypothetical protein